MAASWSMIAAMYQRYGIKLHRLTSTIRYVIVNVQSAVDKNDHSRRQNSSQRQISTTSIISKDLDSPMGKTHNPKEVESGWYDWWVQQGYFKPSDKSDAGDSEIFAMLLPPPNVTGNLHLGHALTGAIQDAIVRWHRMKGVRTVWIPGTDHAGIATHAVVEKKLWREQGKMRHDLGREVFVKEIWRWKAEHGDTITQQMRMLGLSLDWSREYFTMDQRMSMAVTEAFSRLYEKGLIYRDKRMINWSCAFRSSLSDIEVDSISLEGPTKMKVPGMKEEVEFGVLSRFAYPVVDSEEQIIVATTRLETMLADTAVAVHPDDSRYSHLIGQKVQHPIDKGRQLPIITDSFVDRSFGTGAVKITPGHDYVDYAVGRRHSLPIIEILNDDGTINSNISWLKGLSRFEARVKLREALCLLGYYCGERDHATVLPVCSRSGDIVEPRLKEQWFLNCREMSQRAMGVAESGQLMIMPDYNVRIWWEWLKNTQDWCLSRQLWWGHRIPVYTCTKSKKTVCARDPSEAKTKIAAALGQSPDSVEVVQDEDVLDTWFSSALLPFSALGWPDNQQVLEGSAKGATYQNLDLANFFPQQLMETGQDILFFWVARMVMLSLELTGKLPFNKILLHGLLRDAQGRKMSKSLGNVIDPADVIQGISLAELGKRLEKGNLDPSEIATAREGQKKSFPNGIARCGADALRFTLCSYNVKNTDINFDVTHVESKMRFCNKIWQSFKFIFSKFPPDFSPVVELEISDVQDGTDLWILSRLSRMVESCDSSYLTYDLHHVTGALQQFWYQDLCDVYLEAVKPVFLCEDSLRHESVRRVLWLCAHTFVKAAAPFMPYICEELYQRLPVPAGLDTDSVCIAPYPEPDQYTWHSPDIERSMEQVLEIVHHVQKLRKDYQIMGTKSGVLVQSEDPSVLTALSRHGACFLALSRSGDAQELEPGAELPAGYAVSYVSPELRVLVELKGATVDIEKELGRLNKKQSKLEAEKDEITTKLEKLGSKGLAHIPKAIKLQGKLSSIDKELSKLSEMVKTLSSADAR